MGIELNVRKDEGDTMLTFKSSTQSLYTCKSETECF